VCQKKDIDDFFDRLLEFIYFGGMCLGCGLGGKLISYGRRNCILFSAAAGLCIDLILLTPNIWVLVIFRFFSGFI
jgi:hypothetical protein